MGQPVIKKPALKQKEASVNSGENLCILMARLYFTCNWWTIRLILRVGPHCSGIQWVQGICCTVRRNAQEVRRRESAAVRWAELKIYTSWSDNRGVLSERGRFQTHHAASH